MSHVVDIDLAITDLDCLKKAVADLGLEWREKQTYRWYGRHVGDYPLPAGFTPDDLGKCEFAVGIPGNSRAYEVGVVKRKDGNGYTLLVDFYCGGNGLCEKVGEKVPGEKNRELRDGYNCLKLANCYAAHVSAKSMRKKGYTTKVTSTPEGQYRVVATSRN
jgi:hypothetical protein